MVLSWGKPKIQIGELNGTSGISGVTAWKDIATPVENTTQLTTTEGEETEAKEEGGAVVDSKSAKSTYSLVFTLYKKKGEELPFDDADGVIPGNYAILLQPEDPECDGLIIEKATIKSAKEYTSADGIRVTYTCKALVPDGGVDKDQVQIDVVELRTKS